MLFLVLSVFWRRVNSGGECGAPRGGGGGEGRKARRQGVPRETFQPGNLAFPQISAPPAPVFTLRGKHSSPRAFLWARAWAFGLDGGGGFRGNAGPVPGVQTQWTNGRRRPLPRAPLSPPFLPSFSNRRRATQRAGPRGGWDRGGEYGPPWGGRPECTASGVPRETYGSWDLASSPISPPRAPPSPRLFSLWKSLQRAGGPPPACRQTDRRRRRLRQLHGGEARGTHPG